MNPRCPGLGRFWLIFPITLLVFLAACNKSGVPPTVAVQKSGTPVSGLSTTTDKFPPTEAEQTALPTQAGVSTAPISPTLTIGSASDVPGIELYKIGGEQLDLVVKSGVPWIRRNALSWSVVEPVEGARNWETLAGLEKEMIAASRQGLELVLIIQSTPEWAQKIPGYFCGPVAPKKLASYGSFIHDVVARYSVPPYNVKYWEFANEPDIEPGLVAKDSMFGCWGDKKDPYYGGSDYGRMLKTVYPQVKSADPKSNVIVGGLVLDCDPENPPQGKDCKPSHFLEGILLQGGGDFFDGVSFHAYDYYASPNGYSNTNWNSSWDTTGPVVIAKSRYLHKILTAYGHPEKFLMNTEAGILCGSTGNELQCQAEEFGLEKANYMVENTISAIAEGLKASIWYSLEGWRGSELVDNQLQPLPVYKALQFNVAEMLDAGYLHEVNNFAGVKGHELVKGGKHIWVLWSADGADHSIQLPFSPSAIFDIFGAALPSDQKLTVKTAPVYVEWTP